MTETQEKKPRAKVSWVIQEKQPDGSWKDTAATITDKLSGMKRLGELNKSGTFRIASYREVTVKVEQVQKVSVEVK